MKVRGLVWLGVQVERFDEMDHARRDVRRVGHHHVGRPVRDLVELFEAGTKPSFASAPVVGFLVDDLQTARRDLVDAGAEIVGGYGPNEDGYETIHFRAPAGNVYEIVRDPSRDIG